MRIVQKLFFLLIMSPAFLTFGASETKGDLTQKHSEFLSVLIGHHSQQLLILTKRKINTTDVYAFAYSNNEGASTERAIPKSLYEQIGRDLERIEDDMVQTRTVALNFECSNALIIKRSKGTHSFCRSLLGKKENKNFDKWFIENRNLVLGNSPE